MYIVMGNGESRKAISYELLNEHVTYGCNGIAREWTPSALVCIDNKMMHEIVDSGYPKNNKCYFLHKKAPGLKSWRICPKAP